MEAKRTLGGNLAGAAEGFCSTMEAVELYVGGLLLAGYCIHKGYTGSLPWLSAMVGLPWTAHGVVCSFYLNMAKSDHQEGGITFESAKAANFTAGSENSPSI